VSFIDRLKAGLARTRESFTTSVEQVLRQPPGPEFYEALDAALVQGDVGVPTADVIIERLRGRRDARDARSLRRALREIMRDLLGEPSPLTLVPSPAVLLVLGVNGAGKTTSIGKLAHRLTAQGNTVLLAAADTFRAAAIDQPNTAQCTETPHRHRVDRRGMQRHALAVRRGNRPGTTHGCGAPTSVDGRGQRTDSERLGSFQLGRG